MFIPNFPRPKAPRFRILSIRVNIDEVKHENSLLKRENKALSSNLERKTGELQTEEGYGHQTAEKSITQEQEIRHFIEESGKQHEKIDRFEKQLGDCERRSKQYLDQLKEAQDELLLTNKNRERLDHEINQRNEEIEQFRNQLKIQHSKVLVAEALLEEKQQSLKKLEQEYKSLKLSLAETQDYLESERKIRIDTEKKVTNVNAKLEAQEKAQRAIADKLEQDLTITKAESVGLRSRMIKAEGALEREKKAVERLETQLFVNAGGRNQRN